jgi:hypothetical protein
LISYIYGLYYSLIDWLVMGCREIRGCRHLQELAAGCVRTLEAALESAISRVTNPLTSSHLTSRERMCVCLTLYSGIIFRNNIVLMKSCKNRS